MSLIVLLLLACADQSAKLTNQPAYHFDAAQHTPIAHIIEVSLGFGLCDGCSQTKSEIKKNIDTKKIEREKMGRK